MLDVLFCGTGWHAVVPLISRELEKRGARATVRCHDPTRPLAEQMHGVDVALPSNATFGRELIAAAGRLSLIQQPAAGYENIDLAAAKESGIPVCNVPSANADAVAQFALMLMLALARRFESAQQAFEERTIGAPLGIDLAGRVLGVVGFGRSARRLGDLVVPIPMSVRHVRSTHSRDAFLEMLTQCDVVSIHVPLTDRTRGMFDDEAFACMREGAMLINVSRGAVIDRAALERALHSSRLGGVGLDVYWQEPWDPDEPLFRHPRVLAMPHIAGSTVQSFEAIARAVAENISRLLAGQRLEHRIDGG